jgi:L-alanine-DL-glutamate epimerase-like enolase superfamily enzyme
MEHCYLLAVPIRFRIALARILFSQHVFVQLDSNGLTGAGEGVLYRAKPHQAGRLLRRVVLPWWERICKAQVPLDWTEQARQWASVSPAVAYAVDTALWDLRGRADGQSLSAMLGGARRSQVDLTEQIFIHDWATAEAELSAILARGTRRLKLKIGTSPAADLEVVRRVRVFVGPNVELRVDANHAYSLDESESLYRRLADLGVLAFEEPLRLRDWAALQALRGRLGVPVILDESILSLNDLKAAIDGQALDILNVKLTRVGGVTLAREYIDLCQQHGIGVAIGCAEDLGIGTAAIVHLAASLESCHSVEGVGPLRLGFDVVTPDWSVQDGTLRMPEGPGTGVTLCEDWLARVPEHVQWFDLAGQPARLWAFSHYSRFLQRAENVRLRIARRFG